MAGTPHPNAADAPRRHPLDEVARRYYAPLLSFFRKRLRDTSEAQDLVQQVFLRLSQRPEMGAVDNPDAYIFQTAANALKDLQRKETVRLRHGGLEAAGSGAGEAEGGIEPRSDLSPERVLLGRQAVSRLAAALRELPERTRDIFMLRCYEGLKHDEIARLHGISVRAVEKHVAKALAHVSQVLE